MIAFRSTVSLELWGPPEVITNPQKWPIDHSPSISKHFLQKLCFTPKYVNFPPLSSIVLSCISTLFVFKSDNMLELGGGQDNFGITKIMKTPVIAQAPKV